MKWRTLSALLIVGTGVIVFRLAGVIIDIVLMASIGVMLIWLCIKYRD